MSAHSQNTEENRPGLVSAGRSIEEESFRIIETEIAEHPFPPDQWQVVRRVIHTTGDLDHVNGVHFHALSIERGVAALRKGCTIFSDTRMIGAGLSPWRLNWFGNQVVTPSLDPRSQDWAEASGVTRSAAAFRHSAAQLNGAVVAIGNAPTALWEVVRLVREEGIHPALIIGVPVGFVQALESKEALWQLKELPSVTVLNRKGGSAVAVAILHALLELAKTAK